MFLDKQIFLFLIHNLAYKNIFLDWVWIFLAKYAIFLFGFAVLYLFFKDKKLFWKVSLAVLISSVLAAVIKKLWPLPRPFQEVNIKPLIEHISDGTFPSKHATAAFALVWVIFLRYRRKAVLLLVLAFLVSLARVVSGVHYPLDILGGSLLGVSVASIVYSIRPPERHTPT